MSEQVAIEGPEKLIVRTFDPRDQAEVSRLYVEGLLAGQIAPNDTGADIENIHQSYLTDDKNHFWVAELDGKVLGMIGVSHDHEEHTSEIRRLRVERDWQQLGIGAKLVETALTFCRKSGALKVVLDTQFERNTAMDLFTRFGFQHNRSKTHHGKELLEFYLDLYRTKKKEHE
ncbi:MAG: GNAT family N-acetyltransferase [Phycisphaeraceae bacterium]